MHYIAIYLLYAAIFIRGLTWYTSTPLGWLAIAVMVLYGLLLVADKFVFERPERLGARLISVYPYTYVGLQTGLVVILLLLPPRPDFTASLFIPLSIQAVLWFDRRWGFTWIAGFIVLIAVTLPTGWESGVSALALILLYSVWCILFGGFASLVMRAAVAQAENVRLYDELKSTNRQLLDYSAQAEELAAVQERNRFARELHDSVTQTAFSMTLAVQTARLLWETDKGRVKAQLDHLQELAKSALGETQVLVAQLRPVSLAEEGLVAALMRLCAEQKARNGLEVFMEVASDRKLPEPLVVGLYRIVQEALNNVGKHAGVSRATVRLDLAAVTPCIEVADEGAGFAVESVKQETGHMGLIGMAERARELGWTMSVDSRPGSGTRIRVEGS